jgi:disulfide bond formation protein DsbB
MIEQWHLWTALLVVSNVATCLGTLYFQEKRGENPR